MAGKNLPDNGFQFSCGPYLGQEAVQAIPVGPNVITSADLDRPIQKMAPYGQHAVNYATAAMEGLAGVLDGTLTRATVIESGSNTWDDGPVKTLRYAAALLIGVTPESVVRNDAQRGEPNGTIIFKGQAGPGRPLYLVDQEVRRGVRRVEILDGLADMFNVMTKVIAFSPAERKAAQEYLGTLTTNNATVRGVLAQTNRYTTPNSNDLHGAFLDTLYGNDASPIWSDQLQTFRQRKGTVPA